MNYLTEYLKIHLLSLEQDSEEIEASMTLVDDMDSDEYKDLEIMDISVNSQIIATSHILSVVEGIIKE